MKDIQIQFNSDISKDNTEVRIAFYTNIGFFIEVAQILEFNLRKLICYELSVKEIKKYEELLKRYERNEARYVLQLPENYVTISINLGFGKAELESLILALAELDLTIDEWFCFKLKDWILADRLSKEDDSGE